MRTSRVARSLCIAQRETCPSCGGLKRIIAFIDDSEVIETTLAHLDTKAAEHQAPKRLPCRAPLQRAAIRLEKMTQR